MVWEDLRIIAVFTQRETVKAKTEVTAMELERRQTKGRGNLIRLTCVVIKCESSGCDEVTLTDHFCHWNVGPYHRK